MTELKKSKPLLNETKCTLPGFFCTLLSTSKNLETSIKSKHQKHLYKRKPSIFGLVPLILNICPHSLPHTPNLGPQQLLRNILEGAEHTFLEFLEGLAPPLHPLQLEPRPTNSQVDSNLDCYQASQPAMTLSHHDA